MDYQKASRIRKKGLLSLIAEKKFQEGQSLGSAIGGSISEKFKARSVGFKEKLDPLNWVSSLAGKGLFGKVATTVAGRAFGRSDETIKYFGGYGRKNKRNKKDPEFTNISSGPIKSIKINDSIADVAGKMYNLILKINEDYEKNYELEHLFRKEQIDEDNRRHNSLVKAIQEFTKNKKTYTLDKNKEEEPNFFGNFFNKFFETLKIWGLELIKKLESIIGTIGAYLLAKLGLNKFIPERNKPGPGSKTDKEKNQKTDKTGAGSPGVGKKEESSKRKKVGPRAEKLSYDERKVRIQERAMPKPNVDTGKATKVSAKALNGAKGLLNFLTSVPGLSTLINSAILADTINVSMEKHRNGEISEKELNDEIAIAVGGALGSIGGSILGAVLTGPFGILGAAAGGIAGGYAGEKSVKWLLDYFANHDDKVVNSKLTQIKNLPVPDLTAGGAVMAPMKGIKRKEVPELKQSESSEGNQSGNVSSINNTKVIGGNPPKIYSTQTAKTRNEDLTRYLRTSSVIV